MKKKKRKGGSKLLRKRKRGDLEIFEDEEENIRMKKKKKSNPRSQKDDRIKNICKIRQKVSHKSSFFLLEQLMMKHGISQNLSFIVKEVKFGIDVAFTREGEIKRFVNFVQGFFPVRVKKLPQSNFGLEILPLCVNDLACLPQSIHASLGRNIGPLVICYEVGVDVRLIDPYTLKTCVVEPKKYLKDPLSGLIDFSAAEEFVVMTVELSGIRTANNRFALGEIEVCKIDEVGEDDSTKVASCHFAHYLEAGDVVIGYDLEHRNLNNRHLSSYKKLNLPDVVLIKKKFDHDSAKVWKLRTCPKMKISRGEEYDSFHNLLAENKTLRSKINLYRNDEIDFGSLAPQPTQRGLEVVELTELMKDLEV